MKTATKPSKSNSAATPSRSGRCNCRHEFQDARYGAGIRLHNARSSAHGTIWSCTVCGAVKDKLSE